MLKKVEQRPSKDSFVFKSEVIKLGVEVFCSLIVVVSDGFCRLGAYQGVLRCIA